MNKLNKNGDIVVYCHHGNRSMQALQILKHTGFKSVRSLDGGIDEWARKIDRKMKTH